MKVDLRVSFNSVRRLTTPSSNRGCFLCWRL